MSHQSKQRVLQAVLVIALLALIAQADAEDATDLVGSWLGTAVSTTAPLPPLKTLLTFTADGTVVEARRLYVASSPLGPLLATPGHGAWEHTGHRAFAATILLIYEGAANHPTSPGEVLAYEKVRFTLTLDPGGEALSGSLLVEVRDVNNQVVFLGPGTFEATRIQVEPLP